MSFDQLSDPDGTMPPGGNPPDPTVELDPTGELGPVAERSRTVSADGWPGEPVSFIRASWLDPPPAALRPDADTDPLPVVGTGYSTGRPGWVRRLTVGLAVLAVCVMCCLGYLAVHNANVAAKWHQRALAQVAVTQNLSDQLKRANVHITTLDGTVGSLQGRLATVTRQEKANSGLGGALRRLLWPFG